MANEIRATYDAGETLYALVFSALGQVWDQTNDAGAGSFENYAAASIDNYDIQCAERITASTQYRGTFPPNIGSGIYSVSMYLQAGANPVVADDERIGETGTMVWDTVANAEITLATIDTVVDAVLEDTGTTLPAEHAALPTANENRDAILDDATRFSGAEIAQILADVTGINGDVMRGTDGVSLVVPDAAGVAATPAEVATALTDIKLDHLIAVADANDPVDNSIIAKLASNTAPAVWNNYDNTDDSLKSTALVTNQILFDTDTMEADLKAYMLSDIIGADSDTLETLSDQLDVLGAGSGGTEETYTVTDDVTGFPIDGVHVWVTTDIGGANIIWAGYTNAAGVVKYYHDLATGTTVYLWRELAGYSFTNPDSEATS